MKITVISEDFDTFEIEQDEYDGYEIFLTVNERIGFVEWSAYSAHTDTGHVQNVLNPLLLDAKNAHTLH